MIRFSTKLRKEGIRADQNDLELNNQMIEVFNKIDSDVVMVGCPECKNKYDILTMFRCYYCHFYFCNNCAKEHFKIKEKKIMKDVKTLQEKTELEKKVIVLLERLKEILSKEEVIMNVHKDGGNRYIRKKDIPLILDFAKNEGIVKGNPDGNYSPDQPVNRGPASLHMQKNEQLYRPYSPYRTWYFYSKKSEHRNY